MASKYVRILCGAQLYCGSKKHNTALGHAKRRSFWRVPRIRNALYPLTLCSNCQLAPMSCDIHTHTPARRSSTNFQLYYLVMHCRSQEAAAGSRRSPASRQDRDKRHHRRRSMRISSRQNRIEPPLYTRQLPGGVRTEGVITEAPRFPEVNFRGKTVADCGSMCVLRAAYCKM